MAYASWSVIAGETPTATKWNILGTNDATFDGLLTDIAKGKTTGIDTLTDGATVTVSGAGTNKNKKVTIENDRALAASGFSVGQSVILRIIQGTGGGHEITSWFSGATVKFQGGIEPVLATEAGEWDTFVITCVDTDVYEIVQAAPGMATPA